MKKEISDDESGTLSNYILNTCHNMDYLYQLVQMLLHIDVYLNAFVSTYGFWTYLILFAVIFCETGLIVTPFLPGDSLLFATGSIAAQSGNSLNFFVLFAVLLCASILGNQVNFHVGQWIGPRIFSIKNSRLLNKNHLDDTHRFYEKHGGKTIIFARFIPIIRTFAPFVAGVAEMRIAQFTLYNVISAVLWIGSLLCVGFFLGSIPVVKEHFTTVIYTIIIISLIPPAIALLKTKPTH